MSEKLFNPFGKETEQPLDAKDEPKANTTVTVARWEYDNLQRAFNSFELMHKAWIEGDSFALDHVAEVVFGPKPNTCEENKEG